MSNIDPIPGEIPPELVVPQGNFPPLDIFSFTASITDSAELDRDTFNFELDASTVLDDTDFLSMAALQLPMAPQSATPNDIPPPNDIAPPISDDHFTVAASVVFDLDLFG